MKLVSYWCEQPWAPLVDSPTFSDSRTEPEAGPTCSGSSCLIKEQASLVLATKHTASFGFLSAPATARCRASERIWTSGIDLNDLWDIETYISVESQALIYLYQ